MTGASWDELAERLDQVADDLDGIAQDAAALVGGLPVQGDYSGPIGKFDPRFSQVKGAQFTSSIVRIAGSVRGLGERIEEGADA